MNRDKLSHSPRSHLFTVRVWEEKIGADQTEWRVKVSLAFIYYGAITGVELLLHPSPTVDHIILITTALTWTIILDPVRVYVQKGIERRFNLRNREAVKAIESRSKKGADEIRQCRPGAAVSTI